MYEQWLKLLPAVHSLLLLRAVWLNWKYSSSQEPVVIPRQKRSVIMPFADDETSALKSHFVCLCDGTASATFSRAHLETVKQECLRFLALFDDLTAHTNASAITLDDYLSWTSTKSREEISNFLAFRPPLAWSSVP